MYHIGKLVEGEVFVDRSDKPGRGNRGPMHEDVKQKLKKALLGRSAGIYPEVISPDGEILSVTPSLREFCRRHNLDRSTLRRVLKGELAQHKGWRRVESEQDPKYSR
jgi:hypothetical protein